MCVCCAGMHVHPLGPLGWGRCVLGARCAFARATTAACRWNQGQRLTHTNPGTPHHPERRQHAEAGLVAVQEGLRVDRVVAGSEWSRQRGGGAHSKEEIDRSGRQHPDVEQRGAHTRHPPCANGRRSNEKHDASLYSALPPTSYPPKRARAPAIATRSWMPVPTPEQWCSPPINHTAMRASARTLES